jgi:hypothetical protein
MTYDFGLRQTDSLFAESEGNVLRIRTEVDARRFFELPAQNLFFS